MGPNDWPTLFKLAYENDSLKKRFQFHVTLKFVFNRYTIEGKILSFLVHYILDFTTCYIHFNIYSASSAFHMATTLYVTAFVSDTISILKRCDIFIKNRNSTENEQQLNIKNALYEAVSIYSDILT